jgi:hypothetical protein
MTGTCDTCELQDAAATAINPRRARTSARKKPFNWSLTNIIAVSMVAGLALSSLIVALMVASNGTSPSPVINVPPAPTHTEPIVENEVVRNLPSVQNRAPRQLPPIPEKISPKQADAPPAKPGDIFDVTNQHVDDHPETTPQPPADKPAEAAPIPQANGAGVPPAPVPPNPAPAPPAPPVPHLDLKRRAAALRVAGNMSEAIEVMERIQALEPDNEDNLLCLASCHLEQQNPMRAAKFLKEHLAKHPGKENVQNALGTALSHVEKWNDAYWSFKQFYAQYDLALARLKNDGTQRWGTVWVPAPSAAKNWREAIAAQHALTAAILAVDRADAALADLQRQQADAQHTVTTDIFRPNPYKYDSAIKQAKADLKIAQGNLTRAQESFLSSQPYFPVGIEWR